MPRSEGCPRGPLQLLLVQRQNVILQCHDLSESVSALEYHLGGLYVGPRAEGRTISLSSPNLKLSCTTRSSYLDKYETMSKAEAGSG